MEDTSGMSIERQLAGVGVALDDFQVPRMSLGVELSAEQRVRCLLPRLLHLGDRLILKDGTQWTVERTADGLVVVRAPYEEV